jgi:thiamine-monophosphate kinase
LKDDAAVLHPPKGRDLVFTVDQMIEGVHFLSADTPAMIGRKLLRRNLSDLAAMGAAPLGYLLTIALPPHVDEGWVREFAEGLRTDQESFGFSLFGGDSASSLAHLSFTATFIGEIAPGAALRRNGAKPGDAIWVTGTIGDAALGLRARRGELADPSGALIERSLLPTPRLGLALSGIAHAAIDISDGLVQDLGHVARESGLRAVLFADQVPASPEAAAFGGAMLEARLTEGDDYELLLAVPPDKTDALLEACAALRVTRIGNFVPGMGVEIRDAAGRTLSFRLPGWTHF